MTARADVWHRFTRYEVEQVPADHIAHDGFAEVEVRRGGTVGVDVTVQKQFGSGVSPLV